MRRAYVLQHFFTGEMKRSVILLDHMLSIRIALVSIGSGLLFGNERCLEEESRRSQSPCLRRYTNLTCLKTLH